jgi:hypothetical protein
MAMIGPKLDASEIMNIDSVVQLIVSLQRKSGDIPWHTGGKTDPWDLIESIMGLNIGRKFDHAYRAFEWLKQKQNKDGSWFSSYMDGEPLDRTRESHMAAYISVGLFHTWLMNKDTEFVKSMWEVVEQGIEYALSLQTERGEIYWAKSPEGKVDPMSLMAGSSSIYLSLKCAIVLAGIVGTPKPHWQTAFKKLGRSLNEHRHQYNATKSRFSMYWFYPVLCGALQGSQANDRINSRWKKYVIEGQGARCVSDQPWVTIAETSELILALYAMGQVDKARILFSWIQDKVYEDGTFWCGYTHPDMVIWPEEKISWTNAVVLMAADALYNLTPAATLFSHASWDGWNFTDLVN